MKTEVIEKLQKILALATGRGATQGEMEAAMARAKEIAIKHGINLATVPSAEQKSHSRMAMKMETNSELKLSTRYEHPYHNWVMITLEKIFGVKFLLSRGRLGTHPYLHKIWVVGEETDVTLACAMFPWLERMFPKILGELVKQGHITRSFPDQNGCYMGLCNGLVERNKKQEEAIAGADKNAWALVLVDKAALVAAEVNKLLLAKKDDDKKKEKKSRKSYDSAAFYHGHEKGKTINLNQMGAGAQNSQIK